MAIAVLGNGVENYSTFLKSKAHHTSTASCTVRRLNLNSVAESNGTERKQPSTRARSVAYRVFVMLIRICKQKKSQKNISLYTSCPVVVQLGSANKTQPTRETKNLRGQIATDRHCAANVLVESFRRLRRLEEKTHKNLMHSPM